LKKIWIVFILTTTLFAQNYELKLYEKVLPSIFIHYPIKVYADKNTKTILKDSKYFEITSECNDSVTFIMGKTFPEMSQDCTKKPLFATNYRTYKNKKNSFGAFYWRKGRPQLKFKKETLKQFHLILPENLKKYEK
jgi:hypothetical protein